MITLQGITWNQSRGYVPVIATAQRFCELTSGIEIVWEKRSLKEFGDAPVGELAASYDLMVIDHPWAGYAVRNQIVLPLEQYLDPDYLEDQRAGSVGKSFESYCFDGCQSALPIDAAAPVAAYRESWFDCAGEEVPHTWEQVLALAKKGHVICAGDPTNLLMQFYMFGNTLTDTLFAGGADQVISPADGHMVLSLMRELADCCPEQMYDLDPIGVYEVLAGDGPWVYTPFEFGYSNYSRRGYAAHAVISTDVVSLDGKPFRTVLGGTGLAVSQACVHRQAALEFAAFTASPQIQSTLYFESGGQPGHRAAWLDDEVNRMSRNFFAGTLATLDRAYLRPRYDGYLHFQDHAGIVLRDYLRGGTQAGQVLEQLNRLYRESKGWEDRKL